jgi:hypothetical protein
MIRYGLEWLFRLMREPARMWRRNFISTPYFILKMLALKGKSKLRTLFKTNPETVERDKTKMIIE